MRKIGRFKNLITSEVRIFFLRFNNIVFRKFEVKKLKIKRGKAKCGKTNAESIAKIDIQIINAFW